MINSIQKILFLMVMIYMVGCSPRVYNPQEFTSDKAGVLRNDAFRGQVKYESLDGETFGILEGKYDFMVLEPGWHDVGVYLRYRMPILPGYVYERDVIKVHVEAGRVYQVYARDFITEVYFYIEDETYKQAYKK